MKILFLGGPSGSGKSYFASRFLAENGWLHLEIDRHDEGDGIALENLRLEWDDFWIRHDLSSLDQMASWRNRRDHDRCRSKGNRENRQSKFPACGFCRLWILWEMRSKGMAIEVNRHYLDS